MSKRLLMIDDEPAMCDLVREVAESQGFEVYTTSKADEFKALYEGGPPDLVVLDIVMPEVDGIELLRYLGERGCPSRVIVVSGYGDTYLTSAERLGTAYGLDRVVSLTKPVRLAALRSALADAA